MENELIKKIERLRRDCRSLPRRCRLASTTYTDEGVAFQSPRFAGQGFQFHVVTRPLSRRLPFESKSCYWSNAAWFKFLPRTWHAGGSFSNRRAHDKRWWTVSLGRRDSSSLVRTSFVMRKLWWNHNHLHRSLIISWSLVTHFDLYAWRRVQQTSKSSSCITCYFLDRLVLWGFGPLNKELFVVIF